MFCAYAATFRDTRPGFPDFNQNGYIELTEEDPGTPENELEITQESHYYPFGMGHLGPWYATVAPAGAQRKSRTRRVGKNRYLYNGKELNEDYGANLYEYGARWYDGALGRFTGVDPIADQFQWVSTYNYAENEPIANIDLWGLQKVKAKNLESYKTERKAFDTYPKVRPSSTFSRQLADLFKGNTGLRTGEASNLNELLNESLSGTDIVYLKGAVLDKIENDPELQGFTSDLKNRFSESENFGQDDLFDSGQAMTPPSHGRNGTGQKCFFICFPLKRIWTGYWIVLDSSGFH